MKKTIILILCVAGLLACKKEEEDLFIPTNFSSIATIENPNASNAFYFRLDNNDRMWVQNSNFPNYKPQTGQRIIAGYNILSVNNFDELYNHKVNLYSIYEVLTKGIFKITPATQDSIGNNPVDIRDIWIGSHFLNVDFSYAGYNKKHFINLVADSAKKYSDGKIHLEFRHNSNGDAQMYYTRGIVSFDIQELKTGVNADSVNLVIHTKSFGSTTDKTYQLTYKFITTASSKHISIPANRNIELY